MVFIKTKKEHLKVDSLTILGSGTCQLQAHRMASSVLLSLGGELILFDCGRGITHRLAQLEVKQDDLKHIIISHFHADHISDLVPLMQASSWSRIDDRKEQLNIYGPAGVEHQMMKLIGAFGQETLIAFQKFKLKVHECREDKLKVSGINFDFVDLPPAGNHGIKFTHKGKTVAITGDSYFHEANCEFLKGVDLGIFDAGHLEDEEIIELISISSPKVAVCSHLYREPEQMNIVKPLREKGYKGEIVFAQDLNTYLFP